MTRKTASFAGILQTVASTALGLLLAVSIAAAENTWVSNQAARLVIGQSSFTRQNPASNREVLGAAGGLAFVGNRLFAADGNKVGARVGGEEISRRVSNNRVLIYEGVSSFVPDIDEQLPQSSACPACVGRPDTVLGQPDFTTFTSGLSQSRLQNPTHVASDGNMLAVSDTDNNRVLIWNSIPASNDTPPNVVLGQPDFTSNLPRTTRDGMRGPQGLWIDSGRLFVADTVNGRVLIWNSVPSSNGAQADLVLGQPDFTTRPEPDLTQSNFEPRADRMLDPVSVTVNNGRMFVSDLGFNRVLIFLTVPTQNAFPADVVVGQPDLTAGAENNVVNRCNPLPAGTGAGVGVPGEDTDGDGLADVLFPRRCETTLSFPRFALSDGERLFVADAGNDRVLVYNQIPLENGVAADAVIGQPDFESLAESVGASSLRAPTSLAHDGTNLYVADPFSRRILVFTPAEDLITRNGLRNGAAFAIHSTASVEFRGNPVAEQTVTVTIGDFGNRFEDRVYEYTVVEGDTNESVRDAVMTLVNNDAAGDGPAFARAFEGEGTRAVARVTFGGTTQAGEIVTLRIGDQTYEVEVQPGDPVERLVDRFNFFINGRPDPKVTSDRDRAVEGGTTLLITTRDTGPSGNGIPVEFTVEPGSGITAEVDAETSGGFFNYAMRLIATQEGALGNSLTLGAISSNAAALTATVSGSSFSGGSDARALPPGTLGALFGEELADAVYEPPSGTTQLPTKLGGLEVYANGILCPLHAVTPEQINFQVPRQIPGESVSVYVRRELPDGQVLVSVPRAAGVPRFGPGLFALPGPEPRRGIVLHGQARATGTIALAPPFGTNVPDDAGFVVEPEGVEITVFIEDREYLYGTLPGETLGVIVDKIVNFINNSNDGQGDPAVTLSAGQRGFFSASANVRFAGDIRAGDVVSIQIRNRVYSYEVRADDTLSIVRNILIEAINQGPNQDGRGDPDVTARFFDEFGAVTMRVVSREIGDGGNSIPFSVSVSPSDAAIQVTTNAEEGTLVGGLTPPVIVLTARESGQAGNDITYGVFSSDTGRVSVSISSTSLCCGNEFFSLVTEDNPAAPGEVVVVMGTGLGLTNPQPATEGLESGEATPNSPFFLVPANADDFVSARAGGSSATVEFVGLMPGTVGVYQLNLRLNQDLPDNRNTTLDIAQRLFISNLVTFPVRSLRPGSAGGEAGNSN